MIYVLNIVDFEFLKIVIIINCKLNELLESIELIKTIPVNLKFKEKDLRLISVVHN